MMKVFHPADRGAIGAYPAPTSKMRLDRVDVLSNRANRSIPYLLVRNCRYRPTVDADTNA